VFCFVFDTNKGIIYSKKLEIQRPSRKQLGPKMTQIQGPKDKQKGPQRAGLRRP